MVQGKGKFAVIANTLTIPESYILTEIMNIND